MQNAHLETVMFTLMYVYYDISDIVARAFEILFFSFADIHE